MKNMLQLPNNLNLVEQNRNKASTQQQSNAELSLLKENAKFYAAVCALELGNDDAEIAIF